MIHRRAIVLGLLALFALMPLVFAGEPAAAPSAVVRLVVDYGDGVEKHFTRLPGRPEMTVRDVMEAAKALPRPRGLAFESRGEGERGLLVSIDGLANEGGGKGTRNWLFWVNDTPGDRSFMAATVPAGGTVTWRFTTYDMLKPKE